MTAAVTIAGTPYVTQAPVTISTLFHKFARGVVFTHKKIVIMTTMYLWASIRKNSLLLFSYPSSFTLA
jgi:hypothetical protein